jgi:hypothetical protein
MQATLDTSQTGQEVTRLQTVIRHAILHQTDQEVARWLELALLRGTTILGNQEPVAEWSDVAV